MTARTPVSVDGRSEMNVELLVIPHSDELDEVRVYFENVGEGKGHVVITCYGTAWCAYFGGMGKDTIQSFIKMAGPDYLSNKLTDYNFQKQSKRHEKWLEKVILAVKARLDA
jgi:hypothetical protein